jgi:flagellar biosynthesis anti-sigma factor FlgM
MAVANKINDLSGSATPGSSPAVAPRTGGIPSGNATVAPSGEAADVHITDTATHLAAIEQALRDTPAVDPVRVAALRSAIEQGQYTLRPVHVAERFLHLEHALTALDSAAPAGAGAESR